MTILSPVYLLKVTPRRNTKRSDAEKNALAPRRPAKQTNCMEHDISLTKIASIRFNAMTVLRE